MNDDGPIEELSYKDKFGLDRTLYKAIVQRVEPDGVVFAHEAGVSKVPFESLPESYRIKHGYDPEKARAHAADLARKEAAYFDQVDKVKAQQQVEKREAAKLAEAEENQKKAAAQRSRQARAAYANQQAQMADAAKGRASAIRAMQRAIRTGSRNDEARALRMLSEDAPEVLQGYNEYLAAKAAQQAARSRANTEAEVQRLQHEVDKLRSQMNGF